MPGIAAPETCLPSAAACGPVTTDHLLGGRVEYAQPRDGLRATTDPVLLAAAVPARPGERVLEGGTGAGAALLCLAARVPGIFGVGIDRDSGLLRVARENARANGWPGLVFVTADLAASPISGPFDHAFANPPYHAADGTRSPFGPREAARRFIPGSLPIWVDALAAPLRRRGTLTMILPVRLLETGLAALRDAKVPAEWVFPIWPKQGRPARVMVVRGRKHGRSPLAMMSGLVMHDGTGAFRPEAEAILRGGGVLDLGSDPGRRGR